MRREFFFFPTEKWWGYYQRWGHGLGTHCNAVPLEVEFRKSDFLGVFRMDWRQLRKLI
jgi:hypothetical protein